MAGIKESGCLNYRIGVPRISGFNWNDFRHSSMCTSGISSMVAVLRSDLLCVVPDTDDAGAPAHRQHGRHKLSVHGGSCLHHNGLHCQLLRTPNSLGTDCCYQDGSMLSNNCRQHNRLPHHHWILHNLRYGRFRLHHVMTKMDLSLSKYLIYEHPSFQ